MIASPFVSTEWLANHLDSADVKVVDASWYLPQMGRDARAEFEEKHVPGAVFFDIDAIADPNTGLPHMLPTPEAFAEAVGALGISERDTIIVYDGMGLFSAARVWWTFLVMGAQDVRVLSGGLPRWLVEDRELASGEANIKTAHFVPGFSKDLVKDSANVLAALNEGIQVVDVRPAPRFAGAVVEPRPGLASGHMPGALNIPFSALIENGEMRTPDQLRSVFEAADFDPQKPFIASCGSGVTAPLLNLAAASTEANGLQVYDGSWAEWGSRSDLPVVKS